MHAAPSVNYPVGRSAFAGWGLTVLGACGLAAAFAWTVQSAAFGWRQALVFVAVTACGALALRSWLASPVGVLRWNEVEWEWQQGLEVSTGRPEIILDLQASLLLRWTPEGGGARWFWLESKSDTSHWDALRRAVYSRASAPIPTFPHRGRESPPEPTAGKPPAAEP
jgi:toxin CptA